MTRHVASAGSARRRFTSLAFGWSAVLLSIAAAPPARAQVARPDPEYTGGDRVETWKGKTVLVVTPHPDDETFSAGGTLALLAQNGSHVQILIYTTDNAGSNDPTTIRRTSKKNARASPRPSRSAP